MPPPAFWLGGGSGAGKTTAARRAAFANDLRLYPVDHHGYAHAGRSGPRSRAFEAMSYDERWLRPPEALLDDFVAISRERFPLVVADLDAMGGRPGVVVEGPQLLPSLVAPLLASPEHALWLLPSPALGRAGVEARGEPVPASDEARALANRYARDALLVELLRAECDTFGLRHVTVERHGDLDLALPGLPRARDGAERRAVRRAENAAALAQLRAYQADSGVAERYPFPCECERLGCTAEVTATAAEYEAAGGALAHP